MIVFDGMEPFVPNWRDPAVLHLRSPRGPDRLSGKTFFLRLWCVTTDWTDWGNLVTALRVRPHVDQWTIRTVTLESNQEPQQCFAHLNQVADFGYRWLFSCCIYSNCVANWCETSGQIFLLQVKRLFFVTKKTFFLLTPSKDSRGVLLLPPHGPFFVATQKKCFREHSMECSFTTGSRLYPSFYHCCTCFVCAFKYLTGVSFSTIEKVCVVCHGLCQ